MAKSDVEDEYDFEDPPHVPLTLIEKKHLQDPRIVNQIETNMGQNLYAAVDFTLPFYLLSAWHGFIAIAHETEHNGPLLLPEMQYSYAHLTLGDMHVSRKAKKRSKRYKLKLNSNLEGVLAGIDASHDSWIIPKYRDILRVLSRRAVKVPVAEANSEFRLYSVELYDAQTGELAAGELGYTLGAVYTSLTGFVDRDRKADEAVAAQDAAKAEEPPPPETMQVAPPDSSSSTPTGPQVSATSLGRRPHDSAGTVQLVALGSLLKRCGYSFWNLGHPPKRATATREGRMWYKAELGARVLRRPVFLEKWKLARSALPTNCELSAALPFEGMSAEALLVSDSGRSA